MTKKTRLNSIEDAVELHRLCCTHLLRLTVLITCLALPKLSFSQETGWLTVMQLGGQTTNMFIVLSATVGEPSCRSSRIIIPEGILNADAQKRLYAALLAAMHAGKKVIFSVSGCYGSDPTMIATDYWFAQSQ